MNHLCNIRYNSCNIRTSHPLQSPLTLWLSSRKETYLTNNQHMFQSINQFIPTMYSKKEFMQQVNKLILENLTNKEFSIEFLAEEVSLSRSQLHRRLKSITQLSATDYIRKFRLRIAAKLLKEYSQSISQVAFNVGFNNLSYFSRAFKKEFGITPMEYAKRYNK